MSVPAVAGLLLLLPACSPSLEATPLAERLPRAAMDGFPVAEAERTIGHAFETINDRYIDKVDMAKLSMEAMRGIGVLDPGIVVAQEGRTVAISGSGGRLDGFTMPTDHDPREWAQLTVAVAVAARAVSKEVQEAEPEKIYEAVLDAALSQLDGFSRYAGAAEARNNRASRSGFGGCGFNYRRNEAGEVEVRTVFPDTPAASAGLLRGDVITHVDGTPLKDLGTLEITNLLRGPIDSTVTLTIRRESEQNTQPIVISRGFIIVPTVDMKLQDGVAVVRLMGFNQRTADNLASSLYEARKSQKLRGVVLDMRGNPGGLLDQAVAVSDMFLRDGSIVSTEGRHPESHQRYDAGGGDIIDGLPLVVVLDGRSASAAEIVAAAIQDAGRGVVIGTSSYGKGTVQTVVRMPNGGEMTLTWSRFHAPSGYALHGLGVPPSICTSGLVKEAAVTTNATPVSAAGSDQIAQLVRTFGKGGEVMASLSKWRGSPVSDSKGRSQLRELCPAENHDPDEANAFDVEVARALVTDAASYARALGMSHQAAAEVRTRRRP